MSTTTPDTTGLNASLLNDAIEKLAGHEVSRHQCCRGLRPILRQLPAIGPAYTMRLTRARTLDGGERERVMSAYDAAPAGAVVVVETVGDLGGGVIGDVVAARLKFLGVKAAVVDGCVRDVLGIEQYGVPVWTREISMAGMVPGQLHVEIGVTVSIGGVTVRPGDLVAADMDGVFVCPAAHATEALALARSFLDSETQTHAKVAAGMSIVDAYPSKSKL